jgi:ketosteroid isomerase-like protein
MIRMNRWIWLSLSIFLSAAYASATRPPRTDEQAVRDAATAFYGALNVLFTGNPAPMQEIWSHADDVTYMGPTGGLKKGWREVLEDWRSQAAMKLGGSVKAEDMRIAVGGDLAVVHNWEKGQNAGADGKVELVSIRATNVFRKEGGVWKMISHHTDLLPYLAK